jgi:hypothetical protein
VKVLLARPRGFCAGVVRAVDIVDIALQKFPAPIYVRKEIVHNRAVVDDFKSRGVVFIDTLDEAPPQSLVVFSAHGVSPEVRRRAEERGLRVIDATCPLVTKVHLEVHRFRREGYRLLLVGHREHDEVEGTLGEAPGEITLVENAEDVARLPFPPDEKIMILTQTTLSLDETRGVILANQANAPVSPFPHPPGDRLRSDARLSVAAAGQDQPPRPCAIRRELIGPRPEAPVVCYLCRFVVRKRGEDTGPLLSRQTGESRGDRELLQACLLRRSHRAAGFQGRWHA